MKAKKLTGILLRFLCRRIKDKHPPFCSAIITAAGSGTRMGGVSKQLIPLEGKEAFLYSVDAFQSSKYVREVLISAKENEIELLQALVDRQGYGKPVRVVCGGSTRQESVANAFYAVNKKSRYVAIHDAARPLLRTEDVDQLLEECFCYGAVSAGKAVTDSLKKVNEKGFITEDVDRSVIWSVQTPQVFSCDIYRASLAMAKKDGLSVTDDNALATHAGFAVKLVALPIHNIKLTTPEDPALVAALLRERKETK